MHQVQDLFIGEGVRPAMHFASPFFDYGEELLVGFGLCHLRGQIGRILFQERTQDASPVPLRTMAILTILLKERFAGLGPLFHG